MKKIISVFSLISTTFVFSSCVNDSKESDNQTKCSIEDFCHSASTFQPASPDINISFNQNLMCVFEAISNDDLSNEQFRHCLKVIYLKQYLYHLRCCNQGYDLNATNDKKIVRSNTIMLHTLGKDTTNRREMINSGIVYYHLKKHLNDISVDEKNLMDSIAIEEKRILKGNI